MVRSLISFSSVLETSAGRIHGCSKICSRVGLSEGLIERHHLISCWQSENRWGGGQSWTWHNRVNGCLHTACSCYLSLVWKKSQYAIHTSRHSPPEVQSPPKDFFILLKGDVSTDHVIQKHAKWPYCCWAPMVSMEADPLWGTVDSCTCISKKKKKKKKKWGVGT